MQSLDAITLKASLEALVRLDVPLPVDVQTHLHEIVQDLPASMPRLRGLMENLEQKYPPLYDEYISALLILSDEGDRLKFAGSDPETEVAREQIEQAYLLSTYEYWAEVSDEKALELASEAFSAEHPSEYLRDLIAEAIERSHPLYEEKMRDTLEEALADVDKYPEMTVEEFGEWLTTL
jgi:hypothetical protein